MTKTKAKTKTKKYWRKLFTLASFILNLELRLLISYPVTKKYFFAARVSKSDMSKKFDVVCAEIAVSFGILIVFN
jgi:hypothetical protein